MNHSHFTIDVDFLTQTLRDLVRINSTNPSLSQEGAGELEIAAYITRVMGAIGLEAHYQALSDKHANAVGIRRGAGSGRSLMWNAHMDTVGVVGMPAPFSAEIRDGRLYGRGAQDMKGSLAAMLAAAKALQDSGMTLGGDLIVAGVADEEYSSLGSCELVKHYRADAAIVTEPTDLQLALAHRGFILYEVETFGRAAHGSRYKEGIDAILHMGRFLGGLDQLEQELRQRPPHALVGPPSIHASIIQGGSEVSIYPAHCRLELERRTCPGESLDKVSEELQAILNSLAQSDANFRATLKPYMDRPPFEIEPGAAIVQTVEAAATRRLGHAPQRTGASFWTDAAILADAGIPSLLLGPIGSGLHSAEEWVDLQSVVDLAAILAESAIEFCAG
jgi:acetylornithine deacetylase